MINTNLLVLLAAFLFEASAPIAKLFLSNIVPIPLASFLYLGSGLGLLFIKLIMQSKDKPLLTEAKPATMHSHIHLHTNLAHEHHHKPDVHHRHQHV